MERTRFPGRQPPARSTIWANARKFEEHGTSLNSRRMRTGRSEVIEAVRQQHLEHPTGISARRNGIKECKNNKPFDGQNLHISIPNGARM